MGETMNGTNGARALTLHREPVVSRSDDRFEPRDTSDLIRIAQTLAASGYMPRGMQRPEAVFAVVMAGAELGFSTMTSIRTMHIVEGRVTLSADAMKAVVKRHPKCKYFTLIESTPTVATYEAMREGDPNPVRMSFTIEQARAAGLAGKDNWKKYPDAMLRARCAAALARDVFPDAVMGVYDPEELEDVRPSVEPAHTPRVEVVVGKPSAFGELSEALDAAETTAQVDHVVSRCVRAHRSGNLTAGELESFKAATARKRAALPSAPKSEPKAGAATESETAVTREIESDETAEAEGDVFHGGYDA
jgi:hypothetical protein